MLEKVDNTAQSRPTPSVLLQMSSTTQNPEATPSPLPYRPNGQQKSSEPATTRPHKKPSNFRTPRLRIKVQDLSSQGAKDFLGAVNAATLLEETVASVIHLLYPYGSSPPGTRSVTLVLRSMGGVAYTIGSDIDDDHKEIHFSTEYIEGISKDLKAEEISGVLRHEMVHCYQFNGFGTASGGLIEGIADWVRLKAGLSPPHWKKSAAGNWDDGYQNTAYFLEHLEKSFGSDIVPRINEKLREHRYDEESFWHSCCGCSVQKLWHEYKESLEKSNKDDRYDIDS